MDTGFDPRIEPIQINRYPVLDSTNEEAKRLALAGETGPLWIMAARQTSGRGRRGRRWRSPAGNLYATGLYHWDGPLAASAQLGFAAALAAVQALDAWLNKASSITIKWPNDVLVGPAKIAGILLESGAAPGAGHWLAIGIGINIAAAPQGLPYPATALAAHMTEGARAPSPQAVLERVVDAFETWRQHLQRDGFAPLRTAWLSRAHGLGKPLRTSAGQSGVFTDLSSGGALVLRQPGGQSIEISAGEVFFVGEEKPDAAGH